MENTRALFQQAQEEYELQKQFHVESMFQTNQDASFLINKTWKDIQQKVFELIDALSIDPEKKRDYCKKLVGFRFVESLDELHKNKAVKVLLVPDREEKPKMQHFARVIDIVEKEDGDHSILCMNFPKKYAQYVFEEWITFQKCSEEEELILYANDVVVKTRT